MANDLQKKKKWIKTRHYQRNPNEPRHDHTQNSSKLHHHSTSTTPPAAAPSPPSAVTRVGGVPAGKGWGLGGGCGLFLFFGNFWVGGRKKKKNDRPSSPNPPPCLTNSSEDLPQPQPTDLIRRVRGQRVADEKS